MTWCEWERSLRSRDWCAVCRSGEASCASDPPAEFVYLSEGSGHDLSRTRHRGSCPFYIDAYKNYTSPKSKSKSRRVGRSSYMSNGRSLFIGAAGAVLTVKILGSSGDTSEDSSNAWG